MNNINNIADYVICTAYKRKEEFLSHGKLQKLLYYIQAWSYGITGKPLFDGAFQAWVHGPANVEIFHRFKDKGKTLYSEITIQDIINMNPVIDNPENREVVDLVLGNYLKYSGADLERISHSEKPWREARDNCRTWDRCEKEITPASMRAFYGARWKKLCRKHNRRTHMVSLQRYILPLNLKWVS